MNLQNYAARTCIATCTEIVWDEQNARNQREPGETDPNIVGCFDMSGFVGLLAHLSKWVLMICPRRASNAHKINEHFALLLLRASCDY